MPISTKLVVSFAIGHLDGQSLQHGTIVVVPMQTEVCVPYFDVSHQEVGNKKVRACQAMLWLCIADTSSICWIHKHVRA